MSTCASVEDIYFQEQGKAEYCFVKVERKGRHITELLSGIVAKLIGGLQFVKSMGWEDSTVTFSRPIRWLLALHGAENFHFQMLRSLEKRKDLIERADKLVQLIAKQKGLSLPAIDAQVALVDQRLEANRKKAA